MPEAPTRLVATAFTHVGAVRARNEDTIAVGDWVESASMAEPRSLELEIGEVPRLALVADGMGGHAAGEVASRAVAEFLVRGCGRARDEAGVAALLRAANALLFELMRASPARSGMGTTVAGLALAGAQAIAFNVGDSRVYRIEDGRLVQLSTDDTPGPKLADGRTARFTSNLITQTLGGDAELQEIDPHLVAEPLRAGARYLVCSDGLSDLVNVAQIEALLQEDDVRTERALFEAAMAQGGRDNVSIIMVRIDSGGT